MHSSAFDVRIWQAASEASAAVGFDIDWYERQGTLWIIRRTQLERRAPIALGECLRVDTWVTVADPRTAQGRP